MPISSSTISTISPADPASASSVALGQGTTSQPTTETTHLTTALNQMLCELEGNQLVVMLVPQKWHTNEGGMIRVAVSKNAKWYRDFCKAHPSSRKRRNNAPDTRIKRFRTVAALQAMISGTRSTYYHQQLLTIARSIKC